MQGCLFKYILKASEHFIYIRLNFKCAKQQHKLAHTIHKFVFVKNYNLVFGQLFIVFSITSKGIFLGCISLFFSFEMWQNSQFFTQEKGLSLNPFRIFEACRIQPMGLLIAISNLKIDPSPIQNTWKFKYFVISFKVIYTYSFHTITQFFFFFLGDHRKVYFTKFVHLKKIQ